MNKKEGKKDQNTPLRTSVDIYQARIRQTRMLVETTAREAPEEFREMSARFNSLVKRYIQLIHDPLFQPHAVPDMQRLAMAVQQYLKSMATTNAAIQQELQLLTVLRGRRNSGTVLMGFVPDVPSIPLDLEPDQIQVALDNVMDVMRTKGVVRICYQDKSDWGGAASLFFMIVLTDEAAHGSLGTVTSLCQRWIQHFVGPLVRKQLYEKHLYFNYRSESEQQQLAESEWANGSE